MFLLAKPHPSMNNYLIVSTGVTCFRFPSPFGLQREKGSRNVFQVSTESSGRVKEREYEVQVSDLGLALAS